MLVLAATPAFGFTPLPRRGSSVRPGPVPQSHSLSQPLGGAGQLPGGSVEAAWTCWKSPRRRECSPLSACSVMLRHRDSSLLLMSGSVTGTWNSAGDKDRRSRSGDVLGTLPRAPESNYGVGNALLGGFLQLQARPTRIPRPLLLDLALHFLMQ